jgi:glycosyltransferase involved in cell wall biosynthesis
LKKKYLRILIYSDHFFPSIGGSENYALDLANELSRLGHEIGVITAEKCESEEKFLFKTFRLDKPFSIKRMNINFIEVLRIIKIFKPDIFHINYQTGGENLLIPFLKLMRIPIFITYHADHVVFFGKLVDEFQMATTFRLASIIMVQSEHDAREFIDRGYTERNLKFFRFNGIDTNRYKCTKREVYYDGSLRLLCIGRLDNGHKYKGIGELISNLIEVKRKTESFNLSLDVIGDGELRIPYQNQCKVNGMENIKFLGNVDDREIVEALCKAQFLILPSINNSEGFGRVILEALSCGTPVIVSKYAGISELVSKYNAGIVYDPNDFNFLLSELIKIVNKPSKINDIISNGQKLIRKENLTLEGSTKNVVEIYYQILN